MTTQSNHDKITLPKDPKVRKILAMWPSVELLPFTPMTAADNEVRLDVLTHLARCAFRQRDDTSDYRLQEGFAGAIRFLIQCKVHLWGVLTDKVTYYPDESRTGLELAFILRNIEIAKALVEARVGACFKRDAGHPVFALCSEIFADRCDDICARLDLAKTIGWAPELKNAGGNTALHACAQNNCMELNQFQQVAEYYSQAGKLQQFLNDENNDGENLLSLCFMGGDGLNCVAMSKIQFLLDCGADPRHTSTVSGRNLLTYIAEMHPQTDDSEERTQYRALLKRLFDQGLRMEDRDATGASALDLAAANQDFWCEAMAVQGVELSNPNAVNPRARL